MSKKFPLYYGKDSPCQFRCNIKKATSTDCYVEVSLIQEGQWGPAHPSKSNFEQLNFFLSSRPPHMREDPKCWCLFTFSSGPPISPQPIAGLFQISRQESQCCSCLSHADVSSCGQGWGFRLLLRFSRSCWHKLAIGLYNTQPHFLFFLFEMVRANSIDVSKLWDTGAATISCYKAYAKLIQELLLLSNHCFLFITVRWSRN